MNKNIIKIYEKSTEEEISNGGNWFSEARQLAKDIGELYSIDFRKVAGVLSILSPGTSWERNIIDAKNLIKDWKDGKADQTVITSYKFNKTKAIKFLDSSSFDFPGCKHRLKTACFYDNIINPDSKRVTIDRHAIKVYHGAKYPGGVDVSLNKYLMVEKSFVETANEINIIPCNLQAITWLTYKRLMNR